MAGPKLDAPVYYLSPKMLEYGKKPPEMDPEILEHIRQHGIEHPLICLPRVTQGNQRLMAAKVLGLHEVPIVLGDVTHPPLNRMAKEQVEWWRTRKS